LDQTEQQYHCGGCSGKDNGGGAVVAIVVFMKEAMGQCGGYHHGAVVVL
jgi:hypothetical protein